MRKKLGGWARLGVVISAIWGVVVVMEVYDVRPVLEDLQYSWFYDAAMVLSEDIKAQRGVDINPDKILQHLRTKYGEGIPEWLEAAATAPADSQQSFSAAIAQVNAKHHHIMYRLRMEQIKYWLICFAVWLGGVGLLFGVGWTIGWVYRGFRPKVG